MLALPPLPEPHPDRFKGQVALVTGGASGIGAATCTRLAAEGAQVVIADLQLERAQQLARALGPRAEAVHLDAGELDSIEQVVRGTVARHGRLDVLHNNAAITSPQIQARDTHAAEVDFEVWDQVMRVNLRGYLAAAKFALPTMLAQGCGAIVNTASAGGFVADVTRIAYSVSKAAVLGLTRHIATQYGQRGVRCNAVAPGLVLTEGARAAAADVIEVMGRHLLTPAIGEPEDVAAVVCFLASSEARYLNGTAVVIDGGAMTHNTAMADLRVLAARRAAAA